MIKKIKNNIMDIQHIKQLQRIGQSRSSTAQSRGISSNPNQDSVGFASNDTTAVPSENILNESLLETAQELAQQIVEEQQSQQEITSLGRTYTKFDPVNDIIRKQKEVVTAGLWSDNAGELTTFFTASSQTTSQRRYYVDIYQGTPSATTSAVQFAIAYGNANGSGSSDLGTQSNNASKSIYSQYKQLLLESDATRFETQGSGSTDSIYVINIKRNRLKERFDAGNFELPISTISSRDTNATGSVTVTAPEHLLIDDSSISSGTVGRSGRVYNIVSGSLTAGVSGSGSPTYYGKLYIDYGIIVLDGNVLDQKLGFSTELGSNTEGNNHFALFHAISGSANGFQARNSENITSTHYFVRVKNAEYNFSNNPSYTSGSNGTLAQTSFINDPKTYITTIGLYNNRQELLAVAKLSQPILKSFSRESLFRVKLEY